MNAKELIEQLKSIAKTHNVNLQDISINYRTNLDSFVEQVNYIEEDLYDKETNSILESVVLFNDEIEL